MSKVQRVRTKICGITRPQDAVSAVQHGADALGLVFYGPSPRSVSIESAIAIAEVVPAFVQLVGLFVNADKSEVERICSAVPLSLLQFHGEESPEYCSGFATPFIKAVRIRTADDVGKAERLYPEAKGILVDTYKEGVQGGTGDVFDWDLLPKERTKALILAGGLNSENIRKAISYVRPYAVDVSGGVEVEKGIKSPDLIEKFLDEVARGSRSEY